MLDSNSTVPINSNEETNSKTIIGTLGNDSVNYTYFFSDSGFWKVVIQFSKIGEINKIENHISEFHRIEKELSKKYGPPMRTSQNEMGTDREYLFSSFPKLSRAYFRSSWLYEDISIELLLESVQPQISDDIPVFLETSKYDSIIFNEFSKKSDSTNLSDSLNVNLSKSFDLRYGENPHQNASFYTDKTSSSFKQLSGKKLSYNNFFDIETAIRIAQEFKTNCCCIIKHANPCGFAIGNNTEECFENAVSCDPISYFGGIVGFNRKISAKLAKKLIEPFLECVVCPEIDDDALEILKMKKNLRVIIYNQDFNFSNISIRSVLGGVLLQTLENQNNSNLWKIVTKEKPSPSNLKAMKLGWKIVKYVKSNAILLANEKQILGIGAGQMSRIDSVKIAIQKSQDNGFDLKNAILASDAFFPFSDSLELANKYGIKYFIQPGGSIKDQEIIKIANKLKVSMIFTNQRLFFH